ncbi:Homeobox-leucine zipper protein ROC1 [Paramyrothecium foliicola]|nr:Homeobox-leucine zipper protein ROC1 [Paramyrothecium foliicola]
MSNTYETTLSTQPGWQGQYSYMVQAGGSAVPQAFDQEHEMINSTQPRTAIDSNTPPSDTSVKQEQNSPLLQRRSLDPMGLRQVRHPSPIPEHEEGSNGNFPLKQGEGASEESTAFTDARSMSMGSTALSSVSSAEQGSDLLQNAGGPDDSSLLQKEEDDEEMLDDDMLDGDAEQNPNQTPAERAAARRKMKRFRLTHQQTRFLMSEFAKQPHPDAAHRERLSREIPGLSPRQVQVWFQNRRAKIKRLTADDRDRMMKMRAVPDDFDNVQALHSPYGAVHGLGPSLSSPVEFGSPAYADHMLRPMVVDVRRPEGDDHISPTGLTPGFGSVAFHPGSAMSSSDMMSPMSPMSSDRYPYGSQATTPLSAGPRSACSFPGRPTSLDATMQMGRQSIRPLQSLHLRDNLSRPRSESLQSPLRSSMSWKENGIDYATFPGGSTSPTQSERHPAVYQSSPMGPTSASSLGDYNASSYSGNAMHQNSGLGYSGLQQTPQNRSRLRAATATLPLNLELRNQYRTAGTALRSPSVGAVGRSGAPTSTLDIPSIYTTSYPPAPLTAPMEFSPPRPANARMNVPDYSAPQMSAPIAAPSDFSQAFRESMAMPTSRTPMRESFGNGAMAFNHTAAK